MAFDGIVISNVVADLKQKLTDGRIYKIYQPENDELNIIIKNNKQNYRLLLSADASLPLIYLMKLSKENPMTAPNFCMLLRKHINNGRIVDITQPGFERIVEITIEHLNELGDLCRKKLIIEIMGKHSNIIFTDESGMIIDSIKHISHMISSVREVLPGRNYEYPPSGDKISPFLVDREYFDKKIITKPSGTAKAIYTSIVGFSPVIANEIAFRADIDGDTAICALNTDMCDRLYNSLIALIKDISDEAYTPLIVFDENAPIEFSSVMLNMYKDKDIQYKEDISDVLEEYFYRKSAVTRVRQKSADLRKIVATALERTSKKYDLQLKQLDDTKDREKYKIYGELINTYGYSIKQGEKSFDAVNYYNNEEITIPLDTLIPVMDNAKKYFQKYNKLKRTYDALTELISTTAQELEHLKSIQTFLDMAIDEASLLEVKEELIMCGYVKGKNGKKGEKRKLKDKPLHFISSDGFHIYVGKNNLQNDELTFKSANGGDMWFHAKKMPGSHVIIKRMGDGEIPDATYEEAARLAAYYSSGRTNPKVEIDYTERRNLKKPAGAKPGFVIYHTNYSMVAEPDIKNIREISV